MNLKWSTGIGVYREIGSRDHGIQRAHSSDPEACVASGRGSRDTGLSRIYTRTTVVFIGHPITGNWGQPWVGQPSQVVPRGSTPR
jgi:hypothetical protein